MPEDFGRLAWPSNPHGRLGNVALDGHSVLIEVRWSICHETSKTAHLRLKLPVNNIDQQSLCN